MGAVKLTRILSLSFLTCLSFSIATAQGWQHITGGLPAFESISAVDSNICWVAGDRMLVMKSTNGSSFAEFSSGLIPDNYLCISARSANLAWTASASKIFKTTNGGTNWQQSYEYAGAGSQYVFWDDLYFWDDSTGIAISDQVLANPNALFIVRTTNGGATWSTISAGLPTGNSLYGINGKMLDVIGNHCWFGVMSGTQGDTTAQRFLIHSRDRGLTWESVSIPANFGQFGVSFSDTSRGIIIGPFGHLARTTDGGKSWQMHYNSITSGVRVRFAKGTGTVFASGAFDNNLGYLMAKSTDYGDNWSTQSKPVRTAITALDVIDQNIVWASGYNNLILRSRTGGSTTSAGNAGADYAIPKSFELDQNFPNPFNPSTTIKYRLEQSAQTRLTIFDGLGREVRTLIDGNQNAGWHQAVWDGRDNAGAGVSTGVYFYSLNSASGAEAKKMILLK